MSSHHIVREKQEPALLVLGLDNFDDEQLGQLLEWSPTLIATAIIAEKLNSLGIKVDMIITDDLDKSLQSDIKQLPPADDDLIVSALNYLIGHGYPAINIVTDEFNLNDYLPFADKINLVVFYDQQKIYAINSGFSKWKSAGEKLRFLSPPKNLKTTGLEKINPDSFKTTADGIFHLTFADPFTFIAEAL